MNKFFRYFFIATLSIFIFIFSAKYIYKRNIRSNVQVELRYNQNSSLTYDEAIAAYRALSFEFREAKLIPYGTTDFGKPLHLFVISRTKIFDPVVLREKGFRVVMVNNGIHPGEPCGIDASVKLARDILSKKDSLWTYMDSTVLCIVPVYNIGGAHNRSPYNRANQNGPEMQGFRANARNLDLNRDYAPMDSRNAKTFARIFHSWKPNLLIDTHTTNGADYQYVMTLVATHPQELPPMLGAYYGDVLEPYLYRQMEKRGYPMIPYVSPMGETPENGIQQHMNPPRFTSGYGRMFNTISFMTESHMFKAFSDRVLATYQFIEASLRFTSENGNKLAALLNEANLYVANQKEFVLTWEVDTTRTETISFMGYEAEFVDSEITGGKRLRYNRSKPYTKEIPYLRHYNPSLTITVPDYYYIPQAWHEVIDRLRLNKVQFYQFEKDTTFKVEAYYIQDYETRNRPENGHYLHYNIELRTEIQEVQFYSGDYIIPVNQPTNQFLVEMLEPQSSDSYFVWNFFDPILQRKEYFSPYIFEDFAVEMLKSNPKLKEEFEQKRREDKNFASNSYAQLSFLYQRSPFFEKGFMRYPVFRSVSRSN